MTPPTHTSDTLDEILSEAAKTISVGVVTGNFQNSKTKQKLQHLIEQEAQKAYNQAIDDAIELVQEEKYRPLIERLKALEQKLGDKL